MDWKRANDLFDIAIQLRDDARDSFLDDACEDDPKLRAYVQRLLSVDQAPTTDSDLFPQVTLEVEENTVIDSTVGSYRIERRIGHGGMGGVYLAHRADDAFQKTVAIKILNQGLDADRFKFERQVLAKLEHPNIARLIDGGKISDGRPFVVMEYISGVHIDQHVESLGMDVYERLRLFSELCRGVEHAHRNLIVHRDLKPANVLVSDAGHVKLLDFGIAKLVGEDLSLAPAITHSLARPMTPDYASPEQVFDEAITTQSDVYSLGILLYKVLTGINPNSNVPLRERVERFARNVALQPPSQIHSATSVVGQLSALQCDDLDRILARATSARVSHRYESARDLRLDLENFVNDRPISARGPNPLYRLRKFFLRNMIAACSVASLLIMLLVFGVLTVQQNRQLKIERKASAFLTNVFEEALANADPLAGDGMIDLQEALAEGVSAVIPGLQNNPAAEFRIRLRVGMLYLNYGNLRQAAVHLEAGEALVSRFDADDGALAELHQGLAYLDMARNDFESAAQRVIAARKLSESTSLSAARASELHLTLKIFEARAQRGLGDIVATKLAYADASAIASRLHGAETIQFGEVVFEYANALRSLGQRAQSRALMAQAAAINAGEAPTSRSWHYFIRSLAEYQLELRQYERARELYEEGYAGAVRTYGPHSAHASAMLTGAGSASYRLGEYVSAEAYFRRALAVDQKLHAPGSTPIVRKSLNLAQALKVQGQHGAAIDALRPAIEDHRRLPLGQQSQDLPFYLMVLARIYWLDEDATRAMSTYKASIQLQAARPDSADKRDEVAAAECELATILVALRRPSNEAQGYFRSCLPALARERGTESAAYSRAMKAATSAGLSGKSSETTAVPAAGDGKPARN